VWTPGVPGAWPRRWDRKCGRENHKDNKVEYVAAISFKFGLTLSGTLFDTQFVRWEVTLGALYCSDDIVCDVEHGGHFQLPVSYSWWIWTSSLNL